MPPSPDTALTRTAVEPSSARSNADVSSSRPVNPPGLVGSEAMASGAAVPLLLHHNLNADHLAQEEPAPEVGVITVVPGRATARRMFVHGPGHGTRDFRIDGEQLRHAVAPGPHRLPLVGMVGRFREDSSGRTGIPSQHPCQFRHRPAPGVPARTVGQGRKQRCLHEPFRPPLRTVNQR